MGRPGIHTHTHTHLGVGDKAVLVRFTVEAGRPDKCCVVAVGQVTLARAYICLPTPKQWIMVGTAVRAAFRGSGICPAAETPGGRKGCCTWPSQTKWPLDVQLKDPAKGPSQERAGQGHGATQPVKLARSSESLGWRVSWAAELGSLGPRLGQGRWPVGRAGRPLRRWGHIQHSRPQPAGGTTTDCVQSEEVEMKTARARGRLIGGSEIK